jgi:hypothetical protein
MRAVALAILLAALGGCDAPTYENGHLKCAPSEPRCPSGLHCAGDQTCWHDGQDPDLSGIDFSAPVDLAPEYAGDFATNDFCVNPLCECGVITTECGTFNCAMPSCDGKSEICGVVYPFTCGCPGPGRTGVVRTLAPDGMRHCLAVYPDVDCPGYTVIDNAPLFYGYTGDPVTGLLQMSSCIAPDTSYTAAVRGCDADAGSSYTALVQVPAQALCGATPLHRYAVAGGEFYALNPAQAPAGASEIMPPFYVWTTP